MPVFVCAEKPWTEGVQVLQQGLGGVSFWQQMLLQARGQGWQVRPILLKDSVSRDQEKSTTSQLLSWFCFKSCHLYCQSCNCCF
jgi:hypothetical protein